MTTPTPEPLELERDARAAKRLVDRAGLTAAPWQLEHLTAALTAARRHGYSEGRRDARAAIGRAVAARLVDLAVELRGDA